MDKCIIRCSDKPVGNTLVRVYPATYRKLGALASKANRSISSVASELLDFALERAEVEYTYREGRHGMARRGFRERLRMPRVLGNALLE